MARRSRRRAREELALRRPDLVSDCERCVALCCVAPSFDASEDFAFAKPAGVACLHLKPDHRCAIHHELGARGFPGCAAYECYGAGPRATRLFAHQPAAARNQAFLELRVVHEWLWLLTEAAQRCPAARADVAAELEREIAALDAVTGGPTTLAGPELARHGERVRTLLRRVGDALGGRSAG